ncbi:hypothetical protein M433DRAFT_156819 [Acidomyces richmondensis BFW]|nr:MAG: hypothetical protein FE78DRAFT_90147 [Acidomyces sp. 'richmondensis']KYG43379.1 hypothetical protein M433DRAFT_156819 [Acidomyces richmondensis BFW]
MAHNPGTAVRSSTPTSGSQTIVQNEPASGPSLPTATLHLRADPEESQHVRWAEDVVDNEGMGKKSSKVCCIYHKPHEPGDSDSDSDSSSSDSDDEPDLSRAQRAGGGKKGKGKQHDHGDGGDGAGKGKVKGKERKPSPNAYERQPKHAHVHKEG